METVEPIAILYQSGPAPEKEGVKKPMKPGGYADSGADIGYALSEKKIPLITPVKNPSVNNDLDWV
ncbi:MAG: carboxylate--amine ligase, partial [Flavitalea sp.]